MQGIGRHDIHGPAQHFSQLDKQTRVIQQAPARFEINQDVDIAVGTFFAPHYGTEDANIVRAVAGSQTEDLFTAVAHQILEHGRIIACFPK